MKTTENLFGRILASPLLWGGVLSFGFYALLHRGVIDHALVLRYFMGHPIEYVTTIMFFVGVASLGLKFLRTQNQRGRLQHLPVLGEREAEKVDLRHVDHYLVDLAEHEEQHGGSILSARLRSALQFIRRCGSAEELDTELRYLAEEDAAKADSNYGLVRLVLWAVPMIGFLGTVVGITMALGGLDLNAINESSKTLSAGLSVAFDTTALAIALDLVLYFLQFLVYREESNLLWEVDKLADDELRGRFELEGGSGDTGQVLAVRKLLEKVVLSLETLMSGQAKVWEQSMAVANQRFNQLSEQNAEMLKRGLAEALAASVDRHARSLAEAETQWLQRSREMGHQFGDAMQRNVDAMASLQAGTVRQTEAIQSMLAQSAQLAKLEEQLHRNLAALGQVGNFEETVNSLAAVIHLLNGKLHFGDYRRPGEKGSAA